MSHGHVESAPNWLYREDERIIGPINTKQFLEAIRTGTVTPKTLVRLSNSFQWMVASEIDGLTFPTNYVQSTQSSSLESIQGNAAESAGRNREMRQLYVECVSRQVSSKPKRSNAPRRSRIHVGAWMAGVFGSMIVRVRDLITIVLEYIVSFLSRFVRSRIVWGTVILFLVALLTIKFSVSFVTQRQFASRLGDLFDEYKSLRSGDMNADPWQEFQRRSTAELAAMVPRLQKKAKSSNSTSMSLLWIARDYFPQVLNGRNQSRAEAETKIATHLVMVNRALPKSMNFDGRWDFWMIIILAVDVLGLCAAISYFGWNWWYRTRNSIA